MKKFGGLEIFRFLCAMAVIFWHYQHFFTHGLAEAHTTNTQFPLYSVFSPLYNYGYLAVQLFWAISGFVFFWKYGEAIYTKAVGPTDFFIWRFSRLYPLHFVTLLMVAALQYLYVMGHGAAFIYGDNDAEHFLLQLGLASNWFAAQPSTFNGPIWSISVEALTYVFFFAAVSMAKPGAVLCFVVIAAGGVIQAFAPEPAILCIQYFFAGGLAQRFVARGELQPKTAFVGALASIAAALAMVFLSKRFGPLISDNTEFTHVMAAAGLLILAGALVATASLAGSATSLDLSKFADLGNMTYSSYLLHFPLQIAAVLIVDGLDLDRSLFLSPFALLAFLAATFGLASIAYKGFEAPAQKAIRAICAARKTSAARPRTA